MNRISTLDIKTDGSLNVERTTLIITNYEASLKSKEKSMRMGKLLLTPLQFGRLRT